MQTGSTITKFVVSSCLLVGPDRRFTPFSAGSVPRSFPSLGGGLVVGLSPPSRNRAAGSRVPEALSCESLPRSSPAGASSRIVLAWVRAVGAPSINGDCCSSLTSPRSCLNRVPRTGHRADTICRCFSSSAPWSSCLRRQALPHLADTVQVGHESSSDESFAVLLGQVASFRRFLSTSRTAVAAVGSGSPE